MAVVKTILTVVFIIISVALTVIILMQESKSAGLGAIAGAAVVASVLNDLTDEEVIVKLLGGELSVRWDRKVNHVFLEGPAVKVFDGVL